MGINEIVEKAKKRIPSVDKILDEAVSNLRIRKLPKNKILKYFGILTTNVETEAFRIYRKYENLAFKTLVKIWKKEKMKKEKIKITQKGLEELVKATRQLEFIAGQMRKARGGATFQKIIQKLLNSAGISCEEPHRETKQILRRIDLVIPSAKIASTTPDKAIFLAVKRTLRERWKQAVPEQMKGARLYLVTLNGECSTGKAQEIKESGMIAYIPDGLQKQKHLQNKPWIRPLSTLPTDLKGMSLKKVK